jgi:hypothetical protein
MCVVMMISIKVFFKKHPSTFMSFSILTTPSASAEVCVKHEKAPMESPLPSHGSIKSSNIDDPVAQ